MKKIGIMMFVVVILLMQIVAVSALTASDARDAEKQASRTSSEARGEWKDAKQDSREAQKAHRDAKLDWQLNKTDENDQAVIDTGKDALNAALDEAEAWLVWKQLEVEDNDDAPQELKDEILADIDKNLGTIDELRDKVDGVENRAELGIVFLEIVGKYFELLTDVSRNTGKVWVYAAEAHADTISDYEQRIRTAAEDMDDNEDILAKLDEVQDSLESARAHIADAGEEYEQVQIRGRPLVKFAQGNTELRSARLDMIEANRSLREAFRMIKAASLGGDKDE